ncbi:MAG: hypothetical protein ACRCWI_06830 [Brevinema sp.]
MKKLLGLAIFLFIVQTNYAVDPYHGLQVYGLVGFGTDTYFQIGGGIGYTATFAQAANTAVPIGHQLTTDSQLIFTMFDVGLQWNTFVTYGLELTLPKNVFLTVDFLGFGLGLKTFFSDTSTGLTFIVSLPGLQLHWKQFYFALRNNYIASINTSLNEYKFYLSIGWDLTKYLPTKNKRVCGQ